MPAPHHRFQREEAVGRSHQKSTVLAEGFICRILQPEGEESRYSENEEPQPRHSRPSLKGEQMLGTRSAGGRDQQAHRGHNSSQAQQDRHAWLVYPQLLFPIVCEGSTWKEDTARIRKRTVHLP